jgi:hypothetical protein
MLLEEMVKRNEMLNGGKDSNIVYVCRRGVRERKWKTW